MNKNIESLMNELIELHEDDVISLFDFSSVFRIAGRHPDLSLSDFCDALQYARYVIMHDCLPFEDIY